MLSQRYPLDTLRKILLPREDYHPHPTASERPFWESVRPSVRSAHIARGEEALEYGWPVAPATLFLDYQRTGRRTPYQKNVRDARRNTLADLVTAECIDGKGRFVDAAVDGIWTTCEESFWGVPAHLNRQAAGVGLPDVTEPVVDLFAAEAAALLAWSSYLLAPQLDAVSQLINERVRLEIDRRILTPCLERDDFNWMGFDNPERRVNNWNPWIVSNWITCALIIERDAERRVALIHKALRCVDNFIDPYPADGGCDEGPGYWNRAGAMLLDDLELLSGATDGSIDVYGEPLVADIGRFIYRAQLAEDFFLNFADAPARIEPSPGPVYLYGKRIDDPSMMALGAWAATKQDVANTGLTDSLGRRLRGFAILDEMLEADAYAPLPRDVWLPHTEVVLARDKERSAEGFVVGAKGGHNQESHNHNDVGNVVVFLDGEPLLVDIGVEDYTSATFGPNRYDIWTMQSSHHTLPTINACEQLPGPDFAAKDLAYASDDERVTFSCDIAAAYPESAHVESWLRTVTVRRGQDVTIEDAYRLTEITGDTALNLMTPSSVTIEAGRLTLTGAPLAAGGRSASASIQFDASRLDIELDAYPLDDISFKGGNPWGAVLTRIRLILRGGQKKGHAALVITR